MGLGVLFAIDKKQEKALLSCESDDELVDYIETIEEEWDRNWLCDTDKSWDAIHRCFCGGDLELCCGKPPLNSVIFGGNFLNESSSYYVSLKDNKLVKQIANEILHITQEDLRKLYGNITDDYIGEKNEDDFQYTWDNFEEINEFYKKVALTNRSVIFTVDSIDFLSEY